MYAQPSLVKLKEISVKNKEDAKGSYTVRLNSLTPTQATIKLSSVASINQSNAAEWFSTQMRFRQGSDAALVAGLTIKTKGNWDIDRYRQFYKGIKVEFGGFSALSHSGKLKLLHAEFYTVPDHFQTNPGITEAFAFQRAKEHIGASIYKWTEPDGSDKLEKLPLVELVILPPTPTIQDSTIQLCYKITISAIKPRSYSDVFVNAITGKVVYVRDLQHHHLSIKRVNDSFPAEQMVPSDASYNGNRAVETPSRSVQGNRLTEQAIAICNTRYSGYHAETDPERAFITDNGNPMSGYPFWLRAINYRYRHNIITKNYAGFAPGTMPTSIVPSDFFDANNAWTEYSISDDLYSRSNTLSGVDAHFNMQVISDYWYNIHERNSWDGDTESGEGQVAGDLIGYPIISYVNAGFNYDNAEWNPSENVMYFGNGSFSRPKPTGLFPLVALDISAHEFAHAICSKHIDGGGLVYVAEPGALNEGFSDIWAACVEKYFNERYPTMPKNIWTIGEECTPSGIGMRNFKNPKATPLTYYSNPSADTYGTGSINWKSTAPNPSGDPYDENNDWGGVHSNSSILLKWFTLITEAESNGINDKGFAYAIRGMGMEMEDFRKAELLVYKMEGLLSPNSNYFSARDVSISAAEFLVGNDLEHPLSETDLKIIKMAWQAVGLGEDIEVYDMSNTTNFITEDFTSIAVGKDGNVWAGTDKNGLYKFNGLEWIKSPTAISEYLINDIKADKNGGIWIGQSGRGFNNYNAGGGVYYFPGNSFETYTFYDDGNGLASRNVSSIAIDTSGSSILPKVKVAERYMYRVNSTTEYKSGKVDFYISLAGQSSFQSIPDLSGINGEDGFSAIGCNDVEMWAFRTYSSQVLVYSADNIYASFFDRTAIPVLPQTMDFDVRSIYIDTDGNKWLGLRKDIDGHTGGLVVWDNAHNNWHLVQSPNLPRSFNVSNNAITADASGRVFIGTDSGLIVYNNNAVGGISNSGNYSIWRIANGLPSYVIQGVCIDTLRAGIWLATSKGIAFCKLDDPSRSIAVAVTQPFCRSNPPGNSSQIIINFTPTGNFYNTPTVNNSFHIYLSDGYGDFTNSTTPIATLPAPLNSFNYSLPANLPVGKNYTVMVKSTLPKVVGLSTPLTPSITPTADGASLRSTADYECDENGWTNYYKYNILHTDVPRIPHFDDTLLLSIKKNNNNIGTIGPGSQFNVLIATTDRGGTNNAYKINHPNAVSTYWAMNRYWEVYSATQPNSNVGVRFYYTDQDLFDVNGAQTGSPISHKDLVFYKTDISADPSCNPCGTTPTPGGTISFGASTQVRALLNEEKVGFSNPGYTYKYTNLGNGVHRAEFEVSSFSGGGGGISLTGGDFTSIKTLSITSGNWSNPATWSTGVVPDGDTDVEISHAVLVDIPNASCRSLTQKPPAIINVATGANLTITK